MAAPPPLWPDSKRPPPRHASRRGPNSRFREPYRSRLRPGHFMPQTGDLRPAFPQEDHRLLPGSKPWNPARRPCQTSPGLRSRLSIPRSRRCLWRSTSAQRGSNRGSLHSTSILARSSQAWRRLRNRRSPACNRQVSWRSSRRMCRQTRKRPRPPGRWPATKGQSFEKS